MKNNKQIIRKKNRLKGYDYSSNASYFLTICSDKRQEIFSQIVFDNTVGANIVRLSKIGQKIENCILKIEEIYPCVFVDNYIIMPNHIHLILTIDTRRRPMVAPTVATVIKQFKGAASKEAGTSIWQKGYYDHIIRNENDFNETMKYITFNAQKWDEDKYFKN
jgi:putative transposase